MALAGLVMGGISSKEVVSVSAIKFAKEVLFVLVEECFSDCSASEIFGDEMHQTLSSNPFSSSSGTSLVPGNPFFLNTNENFFANTERCLLGLFHSPEVRRD